MIVTSSWPHSLENEFLDEEIWHVAEWFEEITIVPMRPRRALNSELPGNVKVDLSLSRSLAGRGWGNKYSRFYKACRSFISPIRMDSGLCMSDLRSDGFRIAWWLQFFLGRADSIATYLWAKKTKPPSLVYTFWLKASVNGIRKAWPDTPIVSRVHGHELFSEARGWKTIPFQRGAITSATLIASVSQAGTNYLRYKFPLNQNKIVCRRLGIKDLGIPTGNTRDEKIRVVSVSSIDVNKRVTLVAEVMLYLARMKIQVEWTHFGDGIEKAKVLKFLDDKSEFLSVKLMGFVENHQLRSVLSSNIFDVFINLSKSEGAPVSLMEAQCLGLATVVTDAGGSAEVVPAEVNEIVSVNDTVLEISDAVVRAWRRPLEEVWQRRSHWDKNYNSDSNYVQWAEEIYLLASQK